MQEYDERKTKTMKTLKFEHQLAGRIRAGTLTATWRVFDDKHVAVNDIIELIDKVVADDPSQWISIGSAVVDSITEKRIRDLVPADYEGHHQFKSIEDVLTTLRQYNGPEVNEDTAVKIIRFSLRNLAKADAASSTPKPGKETPATGVVPTEAKLFADGGSRGNPGPSASGYAILTMDDQVVVKNGVYLGVTTNNQAEYQALRLGLEEAIRQGVQEVHVYMDSLLVVNQMLGIFKVKNRDLWPIHDAIKELLPRFKRVSFAHVPRELNKIADGQVNVALDKQAGL